jgi:hypothetical protein
MTTSAADIKIPDAVDVAVTDDTLTVELADGRSLSVPLSWYPRLLNATPGERANWRLIGKGSGINWPDVDEDISIEGLIAGRGSAETAASLRRWLAQRKA